MNQLSIKYIYSLEDRNFELSKEITCLKEEIERWKSSDEKLKKKVSSLERKILDLLNEKKEIESDYEKKLKSKANYVEYLKKRLKTEKENYKKKHDVVLKQAELINEMKVQHRDIKDTSNYDIACEYQEKYVDSLDEIVVLKNELKSTQDYLDLSLELVNDMTAPLLKLRKNNGS